MEIEEYNSECIVVEWTQISNFLEIEDHFGNLYFVDVNNITDGNVRKIFEIEIFLLIIWFKYKKDEIIAAKIIIGDQVYEDCLCKVIDRTIIQVDPRNFTIRVSLILF